MYIVNLSKHRNKLRKVCVYLLENAPRDTLGDLIPPFDAWVNTLENAIKASTTWINALEALGAVSLTLREGLPKNKTKGGYL